MPYTFTFYNFFIKDSLTNKTRGIPYGFTATTDGTKFIGVMDAYDINGEPQSLSRKSSYSQYVHFILHTNTDIVETYKILIRANAPFVKQVIKDHIRFINKTTEDLLKKCQKTDNDIEKEFIRTFIENIQDYKVLIKKVYEKNSYTKVSDSLITDHDIEQARQYPVGDIIKFNKMGFAQCPFHSEKTASLKKYDNNTVYCFGCHKYADSISLSANIHGENFIQTVKRLANK